MFRSRKITRCVYALLTPVALSTPAMADCAQTTSGHHAPLDYAPMVITGPASYLASGLAYTTDGTIYLTGALLTSALFCAPVMIVIGDLTQSPMTAGEIFRPCSQYVLESVSDKYWDTDLGPAVYHATDSLRFPLD